MQKLSKLFIWGGIVSFLGWSVLKANINQIIKKITYKGYYIYKLDISLQRIRFELHLYIQNSNNINIPLFAKYVNIYIFDKTIKVNIDNTFLFTAVNQIRTKFEIPYSYIDLKLIEDILNLKSNPKKIIEKISVGIPLNNKEYKFNLK